MKSPILSRLLWIRGLRAFADGYISLLLPLYLLELGMGPLQVGILATGTLLGSGVLTILVGLYAHGLQYRALLTMAALLMAGTGFGFAVATDFWPLLMIAIVGTLNPSSGDVSVFLPLEHALLSGTVATRQRTALFARYSLIGSLAGALGALFAGTTDLMAAATTLDMKAALRAMFILYGVLGLVSAMLYATLPKVIGAAGEPGLSPAPLKQSKRIVYTLAALFSVDAFGGGFVVQSMVALWLFEKFHLSISTAGTIFFWAGILSALSYLAASRIADRFGLVNTMVFTHLPSNILLILVPLMPTVAWAVHYAIGAQRAVPNGRSDAKFVCHGCCAYRRAPRRCQHHVRTPQPGICCQPLSRRLSA